MLLATGHPAIPTGEIDFTPLLYMAILLLAFRRSRFPFRFWVIPAALFLGGLIDSIADGLRVSTPTVLAVLGVLWISAPHFGMPARSPRPPAV